MKNNIVIARIENLYYLLNPIDKTAKVTYKNAKKWDNADYVKGGLTIPSSVDYGGTAYDVTEICDEAFSGCSQLRFVTVPDSVTEIGRNAFDDCRALETVILPDTLSKVGEQAFFGCSRLHTINIPKRLSEIGYQTFWDCPALKTVTIPWTLYPIEIDEMAFDSGIALNFENGPEQLDPR